MFSHAKSSDYTIIELNLNSVMGQSSSLLIKFSGAGGHFASAHTNLCICVW